MDQHVDVRCPIGPRRLFAKLKLAGERPTVIQPGNLLELHCYDCTKARKKNSPDIERILHRYNLLGELVETIEVKNSGIEEKL